MPSESVTCVGHGMCVSDEGRISAVRQCRGFVAQCWWSDWATRLVCKRSPRTSRHTALSRHAPQYRGPASVQQLRRQPRRSSTCEVCAWGGLSAAGMCTRDAMRMESPSATRAHARRLFEICGTLVARALRHPCGQSNAAKYGRKVWVYKMHGRCFAEL